MEKEARHRFGVANPPNYHCPLQMTARWFATAADREAELITSGYSRREGAKQLAKWNSDYTSTWRARFLAAVLRVSCFCAFL